MSTQIICDDCGEPVDETKPHYQLTGTKVQKTGDALVAVDNPVMLHYHEAHLPVYKIAGEEIVPTAPPVVESPEGVTPEHPIVEPTPTEPPTEG